jgi:hypothetical protein
MVTLNMPVWVCVPLNTPSAVRLKPGGNAPEITLRVYGEALPPLAMSV